MRNSCEPWLTTMRRCLVRAIRVLSYKAFCAAIVFAVAAAVCAAPGDPVADLKAAAAAMDAKRYAAAITLLDPLSKRLPKLADYVAFFQATSKVEMGDY